MQNQQQQRQTSDDFDDSDEEWEVKQDKVVPAQSHYNEPDVSQMDPQERELAGDEVPIQFNLPNGSTLTRRYVMAHTIAWLKAQLEELCGLPYSQTTLSLNGKVLIDPLSLSDLPFRAKELNIVVVETKP